MKALLIGGTGTISMAISQQLAQLPEWELFVINRGNNNDSLPQNVNQIQADINDEKKVDELLGELKFDVVCDFIGFVPEQVERDYRLFKNRTRQYIYISSASAYQKPLSSPIVNEATPLANPYWQYSRDKIACEELLMKLYREKGFPITIVRPSHTYNEKSVPLGVHGKQGSWQVLKRMLEHKPVIIHGDGTSLWTMTHNSDFAKGFIGLMGNIHAIGEAFATMHYTVTYRVDFTHFFNYAMVFIDQSIDYQLNGNFMVRNRRGHFYGVFISRRVLQYGAIHTDTFNKTFGHNSFFCHVNKLIFEGRTATVYYENNHDKPPKIYFRQSRTQSPI